MFVPVLKYTVALERVCASFVVYGSTGSDFVQVL